MNKRRYIRTRRLTILAATSLASFAHALQPLGQKQSTSDFPSGRLRAIVGSKYQASQTKHFNVYSDATENDLAPIVNELEDAYRSIARLSSRLNMPLLETGRKLQIVYCNKFNEFHLLLHHFGVANTDISGLHLRDRNITVLRNVRSNSELQRIARRVERLQREASNDQKTGETESKGDLREVESNRITKLREVSDLIVTRFNTMTVRHEVAHHILFDRGMQSHDGAQPTWLTEGLACIAETPGFTTQDATIATNRLRADDLRIARSRQKVVPSIALIAVSSLVDGDQTPFRYAQAWGLTYFLVAVKPAAFRVYIEKLRMADYESSEGNLRVQEDFEAAFGKADEEFERRWLDFATAPNNSSP